MKRIALVLLAVLAVAAFSAPSFANNAGGVPNNGDAAGKSADSSGRGGVPGGNQGNGPNAFERGNALQKT